MQRQCPSSLPFARVMDEVLEDSFFGPLARPGFGLIGETLFAPRFPRPAPSMRLDIDEDAHGMHIVADLPGFRKEDIRVELKGRNLTISANTSSESSDPENNTDAASEQSTASTSVSTSKPAVVDSTEEGDEVDTAEPTEKQQGQVQSAPSQRKRRNVLRAERYHGHVERRIQLPKHIDEAAITAKHQDGLLCVTIPKAAPPSAPQPRLISLQ